MRNLWKVAALLLGMTLSGCTEPPSTAPSSAEPNEMEAIARTEFTESIENFFEYEPLKAANASQFRIHLTDLSDGSPVEKADVSLTVRKAGAAETVVQTTAKVGKVTGIYVAELRIPTTGLYDVEFRIKNAKLDERFPLSGFKVE